MTTRAWTTNEERFAGALADGRTEAEAARVAGFTPQHARKLLANAGFQAHVDALTLGRAGAARAEALRIALRKLRDAAGEPSKKDALDWVKLIWALASDAQEGAEVEERLREWEASVGCGDAES